MRRFMIVSIVFGLLVGIRPGELQATAAGGAAPPFELVTFAGESYSNEAIKGKPMLLVFWTPWYKMCQRELPLLSEFYRRDKPASLGVVSIGFADTRTRRNGQGCSTTQRHTMRIVG